MEQKKRIRSARREKGVSNGMVMGIASTYRNEPDVFIPEIWMMQHVIRINKKENIK